MSASSETRDIATDVTVYGATGFLGYYVCKYLLAAMVDSPRPFRLTLAGRNRSKLEERKESLNAGASVVDVFVADSSDAAALVQMATRTQVVLNCAGPFAKYGTNVVAACAQTGADYVDITGEVTWVALMRSKYGSVAKESGARIISLCGFDSVPSDLSIYAAVQALRKGSKEGESIEIERGCSWHSCMGGANGGTLHTALDIPVDVRGCIMTREGNRRKVPFFFEDPLALTHPSKVRYNPDYQECRDTMALSEWWNQVPSFDSIVNGGVSVGFFMAGANAKVVQASAVVLDYGPNFYYRERYFPVGFRWTRLLGVFSIVPAFLYQVSLLAIVAVFKFPILGKKAAEILLPAGGGWRSGLPEAVIEKCYTQVYADVRTKENDAGCVDRATCFIAFEGDPGTLATAQSVSESALALVFNRPELPSRSEDGFGTPAELLGPVLLKRLQESKVRKVQITTTVRKQVPLKECSMYM